MADAPDDPEMDRHRAEAVTGLARSMQEVIAAHLSIHGANDPKAPAIVGGAMMLVIADITTRADPLFGPTMATNLLRDYGMTGKPE